MNASDFADPAVLIGGLLGLVVLVVLLLKVYFAREAKGAKGREASDDSSPRPDDYAAKPDACPFCGWRKMHVQEIEEHKLFRVRCCGCQAQGPFGMSEGHAIRRWNNRVFVVR